MYYNRTGNNGTNSAINDRSMIAFLGLDHLKIGSTDLAVKVSEFKDFL